MEIARHWRLKNQRYRLQGSTCLLCGQPGFPPRSVCPDCAALPARSDGWGLAQPPAAIALADLQAPVRYPVLERVMG